MFPYALVGKGICLPLYTFVHKFKHKILNKNTSQYFIAALNNCHTEYARFLFESGYQNSQIDFFLKIVFSVQYFNENITIFVMNFALILV